jgi:hypothetical protein
MEDASIDRLNGNFSNMQLEKMSIEGTETMNHQSTYLDYEGYDDESMFEEGLS